MFHRNLAVAVFMCCTGFSAAAQERQFALGAPAALQDSGLLEYLLPRFSLKNSIRITVVETDGSDAGALDAVLTAAPETRVDGEQRKADPVFADAQGTIYGLLLPRAPGADPGAEYASRFADWLRSDTGLRTVEAFAVDGAQLFTASLPQVEEEVVVAETGDIALGEELSLKHCGRCHVVSPKNRMNGLGSTPSFRGLNALPDWDYRFQVFHVLNPHPAFTQIADVTEPFDPMRPSPIAPMDLTQDDLDAILAYVYSLVPADLGAPVQAQ